jgi:shikimate kinase
MATATISTVRILAGSERNLILTGYTGPNQPQIGRRVAERLGVRLFNVEREIEERTGMTAAEIRSTYGESRLKTIEAEVVQEAVLYRGAVIRISGQTLMHSNHFERLQETGEVVCLVSGLDSVLQTLHLTLGARYHNPNERALALGELKREWAVRKLPGIHEIWTTYLTPDEIAETVVAFWEKIVL